MDSPWLKFPEKMWQIFRFWKASLFQPSVLHTTALTNPTCSNYKAKCKTVDSCRCTLPYPATLPYINYATVIISGTREGREQKKIIWLKEHQTCHLISQDGLRDLVDFISDTKMLPVTHSWLIGEIIGPDGTSSHLSLWWGAVLQIRIQVFTTFISNV